ncbi:MAG: hypothetical protein Q7R95_03820, partial [bacterium]|nr:hypothetical protein [bacterium]
MNYQSIKNDRDNTKLQHKNNMRRLGFFILIPVVLIIIGLSLLGIYELRAEREILKKRIETVESEKYNLSNRNYQNEKLLEKYKEENQRLIHELRNNRNQIQTNNVQIKQEPQRKDIATVQMPKPEPTNIINQQIYNNTKINSQPKNNQTTKIYQNYSDILELISDSKITKLSDNRLYSNAQIYGRYYGENQNSIDCDRKEKLYN